MKRDVSPNRGNKDYNIKEEQSGAHPSPFIVIFTDLDGTLLDHNSYGWQKAEPALRLCREKQIPLIPVSSKTRAEIRVLQQELGLSSPFVSENGGGIFFPKEGKYPHPSDAILSLGVRKWSIGPTYDSLIKALGEIRDEQGWKIRGFSEMTTEEISRITGLDLASARLASQREYDEPFVLMEEEGICNMDVLNHAASQKGLRITRGGRFYHLHGKDDKGEAMERLMVWYRTYHPSLLTIALGDSPVDFSMLKRADYPVLIRSSHQYPELKKIPRLRVTQEPGPKGWNTAVLGILNDEISIG